MAEYTRNMRQAATYWGPPTADFADVKTYPAPVDLSCRWEDKALTFRTAEGEEAVSDAIVYTDQVVEPKGYLFLGTSVAADPRAVDGAREIRQIGRTFNLRATERLNKAFL